MHNSQLHVRSTFEPVVGVVVAKSYIHLVSNGYMGEVNLCFLFAVISCNHGNHVICKNSHELRLKRDGKT